LSNRPAGTLRLAWKLLVRDWRAGELTVLAAALLVAVASMTGVAFLTDRVGQAVEMRAAESLAADLRLDSTRPISANYADLAAASGMHSARVTRMPSVVFAGDANTLAVIRAATSGYPLRGRLKTSERLLGEVQITDAIPAPGEAWAAPRLLARLGVDSGTEIEVGAARLRVTRVLDFRPD
jgi:putative ABC transport system permease protein